MIDFKGKTAVLKVMKRVSTMMIQGGPANGSILFDETATCRGTVVTDRTL